MLRKVIVSLIVAICPGISVGQPLIDWPTQPSHWRELEGASCKDIESVDFPNAGGFAHGIKEQETGQVCSSNVKQHLSIKFSIKKDQILKPDLGMKIRMIHVSFDENNARCNGSSAEQFPGVDLSCNPGRVELFACLNGTVRQMYKHYKPCDMSISVNSDQSISIESPATGIRTNRNLTEKLILTWNTKKQVYMDSIHITSTQHH